MGSFGDLKSMVTRFFSFHISLYFLCSLYESKNLSSGNWFVGNNSRFKILINSRFFFVLLNYKWFLKGYK